MQSRPPLKMRQGSKFTCTWRAYNPLPNGDPDLSSPYVTAGFIAVLTLSPWAADPLVFKTNDPSPKITINNAGVIVVSIGADITAGYMFSANVEFELEIFPGVLPADRFTLDAGTIRFQRQLSNA